MKALGVPPDGSVGENRKASLGAMAVSAILTLLVLLVNALVMHDLYHAIFALASANAPTPNGVENEQPDYTQDSPPAG